MKNLKTVLFYILGLAGLVAASILFTGQVEVEISDLPPTATSIRPPPPTATRRPPCLTTPRGMTDGYLPNAPLTTTLAPPNFPGQRLVISGTVYAADCVTPLPNMLVEVWHADANGVYHRTTPHILRAQFKTGEKGRYQFNTIKPGYYKTGDLIRPALIHYRLSYQGRRVLSTQLFFAGDPFLTDYWTVFPDTITSLTRQEGADGPVLKGTFNLAVPVNPE